MRACLFASIALAAATAASAAQPSPGAGQAASAAPESANQIVVTGQKDSRKAIGDFVKSLTPTDSAGQLGRFERSVCPIVYGLAAPQAEAVEQRIRTVAKSIGIAVSGAGCAPNLVVAATSDKKVFIEALRHDRGDFFGDMTTHDIRAMEQSSEPAAAWQVDGPPVSADGRELYWDPVFNTWTNKTIESPSRLTRPVHPQFGAAIVVVEKKALAGLTTTQLADYAAMRTLTGADPMKLANSGAPTILHVLEVPIGGEAPITMTKWDFAFLKSYYDARRNLSASRQRSAIGESMEKQIKQPPGQ